MHADCLVATVVLRDGVDGVRCFVVGYAAAAGLLHQRDSIRDRDTEFGGSVWKF